MAAYTKGYVRRGQGPIGASQGLYALQQAADKYGLGKNPYLQGGFDADKRPNIGSYGDLMQAYDWFRSRGLDYVAGRHTDASGRPVASPNVPNAYEPTDIGGVYKTKRWIDPTTLTGAGLKYGGTGITVPHRADLSYGANPLYAAAIAAHPEGAAAIGDYGPVTADLREIARAPGFGQGKSGAANAPGDAFAVPAVAADTSLPAVTKAASPSGLAGLAAVKPAVATTVAPMTTRAASPVANLDMTSDPNLATAPTDTTAQQGMGTFQQYLDALLKQKLPTSGDLANTIIGQPIF